MSAPLHAVGDRVRKLKGVGKGEIGTVISVEGNRVKVERDNGGCFVRQAAANFEQMSPSSSPTIHRLESAPPAAAEATEVHATEHAQTLKSFTAPHRLVVCAWNTLKLRIATEPKCSLQFQNCVRRLGIGVGADVILLSEIPKEAGAGRVGKLQAELQRVTGDEWVVHWSELSGVGPQENQPEHHVALVRQRAGLQVVHSMTHKTYRDSSLVERRLDHAPFTVFVRDDRFANAACREFALTSVHFPPQSRKKDLVVQVKGFMASHAQRADWPDKVKSTRPVTFNGLHNHFATCVVGGDFNCNPAKEPGLLPSSWQVQFENNTATSSGRKAYDNFVVNRGAVHAWMDISKTLCGFPLSRSGKSGLSDHDAVVVGFTEHVDHVVVE